MTVEKKLPPSKQTPKKDIVNKNKIPPVNDNKLDKSYTTSVGLGVKIGNTWEPEYKVPCFDDGVYKRDQPMLPLRDIKQQTYMFPNNYYEKTNKDMSYRVGVGNVHGGTKDKLSKPWHPQHVKYVNKQKVFA